MRTFTEIYNDAEQCGIVSAFNVYNQKLQESLAMGWDTNSINVELSEQQIKKLMSLQYEITGIRAGTCSGCIQDVIRNMNRWLKNNKPNNQTNGKTNRTRGRAK